MPCCPYGAFLCWAPPAPPDFRVKLKGLVVSSLGFLPPQTLAKVLQ
jgi:hypothetical protein